MMTHTKLIILILFSGFTFFNTPIIAQNFDKHFVEQGETLTIIAKKYGVAIEDILFMNQDILENENELRLGMILKIPEKSIFNNQTPAYYPYGTLHLIKSGEYLTIIAEQYKGVKVGDIMKCNNIPSIDSKIQRGRILIIPPPDGKPIEWDKIENKYLFDMVGNIDNPYLMPEYLEYLLPEGEDALHDLARDYAEGKNDSPIILESPLKETEKKEEEILKKDDERVLKEKTEAPILQPAEKTPVLHANSPTIVQKGVAVELKGTEVEESDYLWAKHKNAPVGSVVWIENTTNGKKIQVRIIGNLPPDAEALIGISTAVSQALAIEQFPCKVQTSYVSY